MTITKLYKGGKANPEAKPKEVSEFVIDVYRGDVTGIPVIVALALGKDKTRVFMPLRNPTIIRWDDSGFTLAGLSFDDEDDFGPSLVEHSCEWEVKGHQWRHD